MDGTEAPISAGGIPCHHADLTSEPGPEGQKGEKETIRLQSHKRLLALRTSPPTVCSGRKDGGLERDAVIRPVKCADLRIAGLDDARETGWRDSQGRRMHRGLSKSRRNPPEFYRHRNGLGSLDKKVVKGQRLLVGFV